MYVENTHILETILLPTPKDQLESTPDLAQLCKVFATKVHGMVMADFGQTDFGQTDFGQLFDRLWPALVLTDFGQTDFGQI